MLRRNSLRVLPCLLAISLAACASAPRSTTTPEEPQETYGPVISDARVEEHPVPAGESYGPEMPAGRPPAPVATTTVTTTATSTEPATTTAPVKADEAKLCLVLGPGMAKALAEAAVIEAIRKAKIPVHCVVGSEMGAVVGALYSFANGSTNSLQWQLFKLNKDNYFNFPMISLREPRSSGKRLHEFLRDIFHGKRIEDLPIAFATVATDDERDTTAEFQRGDLADALSASLAMPGIFDPWKVGSVPYRSAASSDPAPLELARRLGGNFLVIVDVLLDGGPASKSRFHRAFTAARSLMRLQKKEASFVIQVNTASVPFDDFSRQGEILSAGAAAAERSVPELKAAWEKFVAGAR